MAKVYGLHTIELRPGVSEADFERACAELARLPMVEGWSLHFLKGDRGERSGKYLLLWEIESVAARDRYISALNQLSAEAEQFMREHPELGAAFDKLNTFTTTQHAVNMPFTDYVEVGG
jgi:hypothetical protein